MAIIKIDDSRRYNVINLAKQNWGSDIIVSGGRIHRIGELPGYIFVEDDIIKGMILYSIINGECEIVLLESFDENRGIGCSLVEKAVEEAKAADCTRVWLITTNDNTKAMRFYQKRNFDMKAIHHNSIVESRKLKPEIPLYGNDGIPILHEIEFEYLLKKD
jgi:GNAT superfamily N-acetyltransferase